VATNINGKISLSVLSFGRTEEISTKNAKRLAKTDLILMVSVLMDENTEES
jgi:hypothetical protein